MTRTVAMRPIAAETPPNAYAEFAKNGLQWRAHETIRGLIESENIDWTDLPGDDSATLIKRNSQRDVWYVDGDRRAFFVKLYHPMGVAARAKLVLRGPTAVEEWRVGRYAANFQVSAVCPLACAWTLRQGRSGPSILITEAIPNAVPLNEYWQAVRSDRRLADDLLESLARLIARAHQCGFRHGDMHPGNILAQPWRQSCKVYFVDLHRVGVGRSVPLRSVIGNLAQLNQWFRRNATRSQRLRFLRQYLADRDRFAQASAYARNWRIDPRRLSTDLAKQAETHANRLWSKRDRRTTRDGRYFTRIRPAPGWRGHALLRCKHLPPAAGASRRTNKRSDWQDWLSDPLDWVDPHKHMVLKDSHSATVCRALLPTEPEHAAVIVKRTLARNTWKRLIQAFGPSRNRRAWRVANMLINRDLPAAHPLAVIDRFALGFIRRDSLLITEYLAEAADLETFLTRHVGALSDQRRRAVKNRLIAALVRLLRLFHARGFAHRDLKAPNLLITWAAPYDEQPRLTFIDMEGIRHVKRPTQPQESRALARLCVSLLSSPGCTRTDRLRFLQSYLTAPGRTSRDWKSHWRAMAAQIDAKLRQKDRRRRWKLEHYGRE